MPSVFREIGRFIGAIGLKLNGQTDMADREDECEMLRHRGCRKKSVNTKRSGRRISLALLVLLGVSLMFSLFGCGKTGHVMDGDGMVYAPSYAQISQDEARLMMQDDDGHIIVDVRRADEYAQGHIPGAILIPNESITDTPPEELPDKDQTILVYCRTGRRSKEASRKLADMGYVNVYEFGGINDWTGEIVTDEPETSGGSEDMKLYINSEEVPVTWENNASVEELKTMLPLTMQMSMYGGFEQVGSIGSSLTRDDEQITTDYGDIVLYSGNQIVVFYGSNSWAYTRLGHIDMTKEELNELLGNSDVEITLK